MNYFRMNGICTLGNDVVYDQLVALLNSIAAMMGSDIPVCVYPFDDQLKKVAAEISHRPNVFLYDNPDSIRRWDEFMLAASPASLNQNKYRIYGGHRRFCAFDGPFEKFIYMDADTLLMNSLAPIFQKLETLDCIVYDFQYLHPEKVYNLASPQLWQTFPPDWLKSQIFCSGFYGSKAGLFDIHQTDWLLSQLKAGDAEILYPTGDQSVLNYMFMKSGIPIYNLAHHLPDTEKTGSTVTSKHFETRDFILYDQGKRLTYLHYIGIPPRVMAATCQGENLEFPYRDLFLHYRYLHEPEKRPIFSTPGTSYHSQPQPSLWRRVFKALNRFKF